MVLVRDHFTGPVLTGRCSSSRQSTTTINEAKESRGKSRRSSTGSGQSNGGSTTPKAPEANGLGIYDGGGIERDFEGVGGWRFPGSDYDDVLWTSMNSRLELPAIVDGRQHHHHRSLTSSGLLSTPLISRSSTWSLRKNATGLDAAGTTSPDGYFSSRATSKSTTALDTANVGKALLRRKTSSTSTPSIQQG